MKKLLLLFGLVIVGTSSYSQGTCATAVTLTTNGTYTTGTINGTYKATCYANFTPDGGGTAKGYWYKFTPSANGEMSISSNLPTNNGVTKSNDTRFSIATGSCSAATMTCVNANDDISNTNYLSELTGVPVVAGTTYYIQWDNRWKALPLDFTFNFTAIACPRPTAFYLPEFVSTSEVDLYWDQTTPAPANYQVDWSNDFSVVAGAGTVVSTTAGALAYSTINLPNLPVSSNFRYFVRADCGTSQSNWSGPFYCYLPVVLPYTNSFEDEAKNYTDGLNLGNFSLFNSTATSDPANYADGGEGFAIYTFNSTTAASDRRTYFRAVSLQAGEVATISFKTRLFAFEPDTVSPMSFNLTVGDSQTAAGQTIVVQGFTNNTDVSYTNHTATYTAPEAGIYYFGIHNNSPIGATETFLFLDSLNLQTNLSNDSFLASNLSVYPNPASSVVKISNTLNAIVNTVEIADLNGRVVRTQNVNATEAEISINDLSAGVYMLKVTTDQGTATKKIVKQ